VAVDVLLSKVYQATGMLPVLYGYGRARGRDAARADAGADPSHSVHFREWREVTMASDSDSESDGEAMQEDFEEDEEEEGMEEEGWLDAADDKYDDLYVAVLTVTTRQNLLGEEQDELPDAGDLDRGTWARVAQARTVDGG
jgi:hypothetical protein